MGETSLKPVKLYLLAGFLGAGKTTLLKRMLNRLSEYKLGVLVNEFGKVGIDGRLIADQDLKMVEINNGSIFCACLKASFVRALIKFSESEVDLLLVENSGLADPSGIRGILAGVAARLKRPYEYCGCIDVLDCTTFLQHADVLLPVEHQVASSEIVLLNKTDLADEETILEVEARVQEIHPGVKMIRTSFAEVPIAELMQLPAAEGPEQDSCNTEWNRPGSYTLLARGNQEKDAVLAFARMVARDVLRLKGFFPSEDGIFMVEVAGSVTACEPCGLDEKHTPRGLELAIITKEKHAEHLLRAAWENTAAGEMELIRN